MDKQYTIGVQVQGTEQVEQLNQQLEQTAKDTKAVGDASQQTASQVNSSMKQVAEDAGEGFTRLQTKLRQTQTALQAALDVGDTKQIKRLRTELGDLEDSLDVAKIKSQQFDDVLAGLPGPAGAAGNAIKGVDGAFKLLSANPVVAVIGAIAGIFYGIYKALQQTEEGMASLNKVSEAFGRIFTPIVEGIANFAIPAVEGLAKVINLLGGEVNKESEFYKKQIAISKEYVTNLKEARAEKQKDIIQVKALQQAINDQSNTEQERRNALEQLKIILPELKDLELSRKGALDQVNLAVKTYIANLDKQIQGEALRNKAAAQYQEFLKADEEYQNAATKDASKAWKIRQMALAEYNETLAKTGDLAKTVETPKVGKAADATAAAAKALADKIVKIKQVEAKSLADIDKELAEKRSKTTDPQTLLNAEVEASKKRYEAKKLALEQEKELYKEGTVDYKNYIISLENLDTEFLNTQTEQKAKQVEINKAKQAELEKFYSDSLKNELAANKDYYSKLEAQILASAMTAEQKEAAITANKKLELENRIQILKDAGQPTGEAEAALQTFITDAAKKGSEQRKKIDDDELKRKQAIQQSTIDLTRGSFEAIGALAEAFAGETEEQQRKAFKINKAASLAAAIVSTYESATKAYASQLSIPSPDAPIRASIAAGIAIAAGLANVAKISKTEFESKTVDGGKPSGGSIPSPSAPPIPTSQGTFTPTTGFTPPQTQTGGEQQKLSEKEKIMPQKVYVLSGDVTTAQEADAKINQRRKL